MLTHRIAQAIADKPRQYMSLRFKKSRYRRELPARRGARSEKRTDFFETSRLIEVGLFLLFSVSVIFICFFAQEPKGPRIVEGQPASTRIVADFAFEYTSQLRTEREKQALRSQMPPIFKRSFAPFESFSLLINRLNSSIAKTQIDSEANGIEALESALKAEANRLIKAQSIEIDNELVSDFLIKIAPKQRSMLLSSAVEILRKIYVDGVYDLQTASSRPDQLAVIKLKDQNGQNNLPDARSIDDAEVVLRVRINALSEDRETARSLYELFRAGLKPNLRYSETDTMLAAETAMTQIEPVVIQVNKDASIVEPGAVITPELIECVQAYRKVQNQLQNPSIFSSKLFIERLILSSVLLAAIFIYLKQGLRETDKRNRAIAIAALSILLNLVIMRLIIELGAISFGGSRQWLSILPYATPSALAPILIAVLVGTGPAILAALVISVLFALMQDNAIDLLLIAFLSGVVGSYFAAGTRQRANLVRAGFMSAVVAAFAAALIAGINNFGWALIGQQIVLTLIVGGLTGMLSVGLLTFFEQVFKVTSEITLLELTDFNHPLLRRMQVEAPGTYHHSLMVANLAENAAAKIGASPLLCRAACLYHDIGKLVKPDYFTENQSSGVNPHDEQTPSISALVIKAHIKEGIELARYHNLPRILIDVIRQHHGTSLIQYFYFLAQKKEAVQEASSPSKNSKSSNSNKDTIQVDESTYRYDGPKPDFKESAIIFFADSVEAASRSLKKVSQPAVEDLIESIFRSKIEDGQLDKCPLTFQELKQIRSSFARTLLNMLHARIEYPKSSEASTATAENSQQEVDAQQTSELDNSTRTQQPI